MASHPVPPPFRRVVVGFRDAAGSRSSLEAVVRFAQAMESELLGVFVEDASLLELSASSLVRQITRAAGTSVPVTPDLLADEFATAAALVRQRLSSVARGLGVHAGFRVERAHAASLDIDGSEPGDLLVVIEPAEPMARLSYPFAGVLRAVGASSAPVLYVPHGALQRRGPIVSVTPRPDDEGHRIAAGVAATTGETLIRLGGPFLPDAAALSPQNVEHALAGVRERLLVLSRPGLLVRDPALVAAIAGRRMVPVLVAGPGDADGQGV